MLSLRASLSSWSFVRPFGPLVPERCPPLWPGDLSFTDVRDLSRDSPERARSLFTTRAAISSAVPSDIPWPLTDFLTFSYWRARFVPFLTPLGGIAVSPQPQEQRKH